CQRKPDQAITPPATGYLCREDDRRHLRVVGLMLTSTAGGNGRPSTPPAPPRASSVRRIPLREAPATPPRRYCWPAPGDGSEEDRRRLRLRQRRGDHELIDRHA